MKVVLPTRVRATVFQQKCQNLDFVKSIDGTFRLRLRHHYLFIISYKPAKMLLGINVLGIMLLSQKNIFVRWTISQ